LFVGATAGTPLVEQLAQVLKYAQLGVLLMILEWLAWNDRAFVSRCRLLLTSFVCAVFAMAIVQDVTGFQIPTVVNDESGIWLNTFFFTPNDLGLFLVAFLGVVLACRGRAVIKLAYLVMFTVLNIRNDAKAVLIASMLMAGTLFAVWIGRLARVPPALVLVVLMGSTTLAALSYADSAIEVNGQAVSVTDLLVDPIRHIINLDPYNLGGSIFDRTDALIYGVTELKRMHWLGLGPGGSVHVLALPRYELLTAKSLHNALAELFVDFGVVFLGLFLVFAARCLWPIVKSSRVSVRDASRAALFVALPFMSVSQSSGYISNYAFWIAAFLVWNGPGEGQLRRIQKVPELETFAFDETPGGKV
jgi:hypothetical protein